MTRIDNIISECFNFHPTSKISILYESCDLYASFNILIRLMRLIVRPQEVAEAEDGNVRKIIGENSEFVNF